MPNKIWLALVILALSSVFSPAAFACDKNGKSGIAPENTIKVSRWAIFNSGINEEKFNAIIKNIFDIYTPIVESKGGLLVVHNHWADDTVNANANVWGKRWVINMYGGYARHPLTTEDGFALVLCHELGHFLGGAPRKDRPNWASSEGESDYFGAMKCLRRVFDREDNIAAVAKMSVDPKATRECETIYKSQSDV
ncbi:MAG: hypothetical protein AABZ55_06470, partial [Bdellovibrionota bacterium]